MTETTERKHRLTAEQRRSVIVDAAVRLFAEKGFRGTTTRQLAHAVGVSEPVLYQHFKTKSDLYSAIIETICRQHDRDQDELLGMANEAEDDRAFFTRLGELILSWYEEEPHIVKLFLYSALEEHELKVRFVETKVAILYEVLQDYLKRRMASGAFRRMDPYLAARVFVGMISHQGMAKTVFGIDDLEGDRKHIVESIVDIYLRGMKFTGAEIKR